MAPLRHLLFPVGTRPDGTRQARSRASAWGYADKALTCRDCGQGFVFSAGEQEFHASKGFTNEPSRCQDCRAVRKSERGGGGGGYGGGYSSGGGGGGYGRQDRQM